jgi:hypothetical protein
MQTVVAVLCQRIVMVFVVVLQSIKVVDVFEPARQDAIKHADPPNKTMFVVYVVDRDTMLTGAADL